MKAEWPQARLRQCPGEKRENCLLRKLRDRYAQVGGALVGRQLTSVLSRRYMADIAEGREGWIARKPSAIESGRSCFLLDHQGKF